MRISMASAAAAGSVAASGRECNSISGAGPAKSRSSTLRSLARVWWSRACSESANSTGGAGGRDSRLSPEVAVAAWGKPEEMPRLHGL